MKAYYPNNQWTFYMISPLIIWVGLCYLIFVERNFSLVLMGFVFFSLFLLLPLRKIWNQINHLCRSAGTPPKLSTAPIVSLYRSWVCRGPDLWHLYPSDVFNKICGSVTLFFYLSIGWRWQSCENAFYCAWTKYYQGSISKNPKRFVRKLEKVGSSSTFAL